MAHSWRTAYFKQGLADYQLFLTLEKTENIPLCHRLHYLQMMTEKLAKGFKTEPTAKEAHPFTHAAFVTLLRIVKDRPEFMQACNIGTKEQFLAYLKGLNSLAATIQGLAPDLADKGPNPEYPWQIPQGVMAPIDFNFPDLNLNAKDLRLIKMLKFIDICFQIAQRELDNT